LLTKNIVNGVDEILYVKESELLHVMEESDYFYFVYIMVCII